MRFINGFIFGVFLVGCDSVPEEVPSENTSEQSEESETISAVASENSSSSVSSRASSTVGSVASSTSTSDVGDTTDSNSTSSVDGEPVYVVVDGEIVDMRDYGRQSLTGTLTDATLLRQEFSEDSHRDLSPHLFVRDDGSWVTIAASTVSGLNSDSDILVAGYLADGSDDSSFHTQRHDFGSRDTLLDAAYDANAGRFYALFYHSQDSGALTSYVAAFTESGQRDSSFGNQGVAQIQHPDYRATFLASIDVTEAGLIQLTGYGYDDLTYTRYKRILLARLSTNGSLDNSFGESGFVVSNPRSLEWASARNGILQSNGKLLTDGRSCSQRCENQPSDLSLTRFNVDGSLDTSFGGSGFRLYDFPVPNAEEVYVTGIYVHPTTDRILIVGVYEQNYDENLWMAWLSADGVWDESWGDNGIVTFDFGSDQDYVKGVEFAEDGRIYMVGLAGARCGKNMASTDYAVIRFLEDGTVDPEFKNWWDVIRQSSAYIRLDFQLGDDFPTDLGLLPDGRLLVIGTSETSLRNYDDRVSYALIETE